MKHGARHTEWCAIAVARLLPAVLASCAPLGPRATATPATRPDREPVVAVRYLTENKKVIPLVYKCGQFWVTNIKLPDLVLTNVGTGVATPIQIDVTASDNGKKVAEYHIHVDTIKGVIRQVHPRFRKILSEKRLPDGTSPLALAFGKMDLAPETLSDSETLKPGQTALLLLSKMLFVDYAGPDKIDSVKLTLAVAGEAAHTKIEFPIVITSYETKGKYICPLKGSLCLINLPLNLTRHRQCMSQEFAMDILTMNQAEGGAFRTARNTKPAQLSDYFIFARDVMAIGDGVVTEVGDRFPESEMADPSAYSKEAFSKLCTRLVPSIGYMNALSGNYVVVDHQNGEFSAYCHLSERSIRVKVGDRVAQGDVIAKVGNTGRSTEPHLHFQLMDSKDLLSANGLPVMFTNVPASDMNQNFVKAKSVLCYDSLFVHLPK